MLERSPLTPKPVLVGPVPGVTVTVRRVPLPAATEDGLADPVPVGLLVGDVGGLTVSEIDVLPVRDKGAVSVMVTGKLFAPGLVPLETVALNEKILSPADASPFRPSS